MTHWEVERVVDDEETVSKVIPFNRSMLTAPEALNAAMKSPDILLFKSESDVSSLGRLQSEIIRTAARYVKTGGELMYSTCSIFAHENERVVREFLAERPDFELVPTSLPYGSTQDGMTRLFPDTDGCDGFFIAKMRRKA